jgi:hypothetical protein
MDTKKIRLSAAEAVALIIYYVLYHPALHIAVTRALS